MQRPCGHAIQISRNPHHELCKLVVGSSDCLLISDRWSQIIYEFREYERKSQGVVHMHGVNREGNKSLEPPFRAKISQVSSVKCQAETS